MMRLLILQWMDRVKLQCHAVMVIRRYCLLLFFNRYFIYSVMLKMCHSVSWSPGDQIPFYYSSINDADVICLPFVTLILIPCSSVHGWLIMSSIPQLML
eukprot:g30488.t1